MIVLQGSAVSRSFAKHSRWLAWLLIIVALPLVGCGSNSNRPKTAMVRGKVTYDGKPLELGSLLFIPKAGGPPAQGNIASDGTYQLGTFTETDGAVVGEFQVIISAWTQPKGGPGLPEDAIRGDAGPISLIPEIYGDITKSGLSATVLDQDNAIDFNLEKKAAPKRTPPKKGAEVPNIGSL